MRTDAYLNYEANLDELLAMMKLLQPFELKRVTKTVTSRVHRQVHKSGGANLAAIKSALSELTTAVDDYVRGRTMLQDWIAVVLVTIVHAYLADSLVLTATKNPELLKTAETLDVTRILEAESIDDLRSELCKQWADRTLRGGPQKWLPRLHAMGARGYKRDSSFRLQHLWDTRNLIVHRRGITTMAYLQKRKDPAVKPGERVRVTIGLITWWLEGVQDFVEPMDQFFLKYGAKSDRT